MMKRFLGFLLVTLLAALPAAAYVVTQDTWGGGPLEPGPIQQFGNTFASSSNVNFYYWGDLWLAFLPSSAPEQQNIGSHNAAYYAKPGDVDGDGDNDVLVSSSVSEDFVWFENLGDGVFGDSQVILENSAYVAFTVCDLDFDEDGDLLMGIDQGSNRFVWFENDGAGNFTEHVIDPSFPQVDMGVAVDFDQDGDLDIFAGAYQSSPLKWFENLGWNAGEGDFDWEIHVLVASGHSGAENIGLAQGDFNDDGWTDVAFSCRNNGEIVWWEYDENWTDPTQAFLEHVIYTGMTEAYSCVAKDMDWDSDLDLVTSSRNGRIDWFENDGVGGFTHHAVTTGYSGCREVTPIDADYDGDIDILSASQSGNTLDWWDNDGSMNFTQLSWATGYGGAHGVVTSSFTDTRAPVGLSTANTGDSIDWWQITEGFQASGVLTSSVLEAVVEEPDWRMFIWDEYLRPDTDIEFYVRAGASYDDCIAAAWEGPFSQSFDLSTAVDDGLRYLQYQVELTSNDADYSPTLFTVDVYYTDLLAADPLTIEVDDRDEGLLVNWTNEGTAASYDLLRAPAVDAELEMAYQKLNDRPLPGEPSQRFLDRGVRGGLDYAYKVRVVDQDGKTATYGPVFAAHHDGSLPPQAALLQSHPNPAVGLTTITFELPEAQTVSLELFDVSGRLLRRLIESQPLSAGRHTCTLNTAGLTNGVYLYRLSTPDLDVHRRLVVNR
ncbi:MAG: T9SS type A sorting domain-containing protein [Candidatus Coatesbacteria bacterium]|nr:T9SS type A sorting domain-containing protein [Candidatus Coatesbacteria bacterium]